jgi:hypothetical protein
LAEFNRAFNERHGEPDTFRGWELLAEIARLRGRFELSIDLLLTGHFIQEGAQ